MYEIFGTKTKTCDYTEELYNMAAKTDNTKQEIFNIVGARVENIDGELKLVNEEAFSEPISIIAMFAKYEGTAIDLKLGGTTPLSGSMFDEE